MIVRGLEAALDRTPDWFWGVASVACMTAIIAMGLRPAEKLGGLGRLPPGFDKVLHFHAFAGLTVCLYRWLIPSVKAWPRPVPTSRWALILVIAGGVGLLDEFLQGYVDRGRAADFADWAADFSGALVICAVASLRRREYLRWRLSRKSPQMQDSNNTRPN